MRTQLAPDGLLRVLYEEDIPSIWHFKNHPERAADYLKILEFDWPEITYEILDGDPTPVCDCEIGQGDFAAVDQGWSQRCSSEWNPNGVDEDGDELEENGWFGSTDGWDDMTEGGELQYLVCNGCSRAFALPDMNWN